ncbi:integrase, catalytic region, zinc finger, CCHC-type containing protein [Tanacetum coccineum]
MTMAFPFTLKGKAKQWIRILPTMSTTTWNLFKNLFLEEYRPPSKMIKQIEAIKRFKQEPGEPLYCSWEREAGSLPSSTETNPRGLAHTITTRSEHNYKPPSNPFENNEGANNMQDKHQNDEVEDENAIRVSEAQRKVAESYIPPILFLGRLKKEKEKDQFRKFFENLQQL